MWLRPFTLGKRTIAWLQIITIISKSHPSICTTSSRLTLLKPRDNSQHGAQELASDEVYELHLLDVHHLRDHQNSFHIVHNRLR